MLRTPACLFLATPYVRGTKGAGLLQCFVISSVECEICNTTQQGNPLAGGVRLPGVPLTSLLGGRVEVFFELKYLAVLFAKVSEIVYKGTLAKHHIGSTGSVCKRFCPSGFKCRRSAARYALQYFLCEFFYRDRATAMLVDNVSHILLVSAEHKLQPERVLEANGFQTPKVILICYGDMAHEDYGQSATQLLHGCGSGS